MLNISIVSNWASPAKSPKKHCLPSGMLKIVKQIFLKSKYTVLLMLKSYSLWNKDLKFKMTLLNWKRDPFLFFLILEVFSLKMTSYNSRVEEYYNVERPFGLCGKWSSKKSHLVILINLKTLVPCNKVCELD